MSQFLLPRMTLLLGLPLLGAGLVCSCASSPAQPTPPIRDLHEIPLATHQPQTEPPQAGGQDQTETRQSKEPEELDPASTQEQHLLAELEAARSQQAALLDELRALYRRLHIELAPERRSALIVELLNDKRTALQVLGFELADRDLSASISLSEQVSQKVHDLIADGNPLIRARAARLITRLVPPDAMIVITDALDAEQDPSAAEPMLLGIARWPNADAKASVLRWIQRPDAPQYASYSAAWALENQGVWSAESDYPLLLSRLRQSGPQQLREEGMKLLAKLGSADDLRRLVLFMLSEDPAVVRWAAAALVETPRAVDVLAQSATENEVLYQAAAESLIKHRATPEGLRRLSEIPVSDQNLRRDMLLRLGQMIDQDRLGEAVRLAQLDADTRIAILSRLVSTEEPHTARSARGVLQLAELQLDAGRPNRVIEALLSLDDTTLEPVDRDRLESMKTQSLILLNRFDEASMVSVSYEVWYQAIGRANDAEQRAKIAQQLLDRADSLLTQEQRVTLQAYLPPQGEGTPIDQQDIDDE